MALFPARRLGSAALALTAAAWPASARAQVHWDLGVQAGASERVARNPAPARTPGPAAEVHVHLALYPMVRVGAYASFEESPMEGLPNRDVYSAGVRAKLAPPILAGPWRAWAFLGVGFAYAYVPSAGTAPGTSTSTVEVPAGVGVGRKLSGPWELYVELESRLDLAGLDDSGPAATGAIRGVDRAGQDLLAVSLSLGVNFGP